MKTFGEKVISFYKDIDFSGKLPHGISLMNPFKTNPEIFTIIERFYTIFYNDTGKRHLVLGINPGRFGAGVTGIPFTDTKRLKENCGINIETVETHEMSSVFVYEMIGASGGVYEFFSKFYISAVCPLGFTATSNNGKQLNYNYYDSRELKDSVYDFITGSISLQLQFGIHRDVCFCLGTGKNFRFLMDLNDRYHFFGKITPLEHPRFIMQYRSKRKNEFIAKYLAEFGQVIH